MFVQLISRPYIFTRKKCKNGLANFYCTMCLRKKPPKYTRATATVIEDAEDEWADEYFCQKICTRIFILFDMNWI